MFPVPKGKPSGCLFHCGQIQLPRGLFSQCPPNPQSSCSLECLVSFQIWAVHVEPSFKQLELHHLAVVGCFLPGGLFGIFQITEIAKMFWLKKPFCTFCSFRTHTPGRGHFLHTSRWGETAVLVPLATDVWFHPVSKHGTESQSQKLLSGRYYIRSDLWSGAPSNRSW